MGMWMQMETGKVVVVLYVDEDQNEAEDGDKNSDQDQSAEEHCYLGVGKNENGAREQTRDGMQVRNQDLDRNKERNRGNGGIWDSKLDGEKD